MPLTDLAVERDDFVVAEEAGVAALDAEDVPAAVDRGQNGCADDCIESRRVAAAGRDRDAHQWRKENARVCNKPVRGIGCPILYIDVTDRRESMRKGYSLLEQLVVLVVMAILLTVVGPRSASALDRAAVRNARMQLVSALGAARGSALARAERVTLAMDGSGGMLRVLVRRRHAAGALAAYGARRRDRCVARQRHVRRERPRLRRRKLDHRAEPRCRG